MDKPYIGNILMHLLTFRTTWDVFLTTASHYIS